MICGPYEKGNWIFLLRVTDNDRKWNYCDLKCLYLENYSDQDFVVISFKEHGYRPDFAACYVKTEKEANSYVLWNQVIQNKFF